MQVYESLVSIIQLYNLAKLRKRKNRYTIQLFKVEPLLSQLILANTFIWTTPLK